MTPAPGDWDGALVPLFDEVHGQGPVVTILCGAGDGQCRRRLGRVWAIREGLLLHYVQHIAPRRFGVDTSALTPEQLAEYLASDDNPLRRFQPGQPTGIGTGLLDNGGWLALVDVDAYWHPVEVGCMKHEGLLDLDRQMVLEAALAAVRAGRPAELVLRR